MALELGKMKERITVQRAELVQGDNNEVTIVWRDVRKVWAYLRTLSGRQIQIAGARTVTSTATHLVSIRYCPDVEDVTTARLTLESGGKVRTFTINSIDDTDNDHAEMYLTVTEVKG